MNQSSYIGGACVGLLITVLVSVGALSLTVGVLAILASIIAFLVITNYLFPRR